MIDECGVADHAAECLCDVELPDRPTPINFGLTDVWHAATIARVKGFGVPWSASSAGEFAGLLLYAYDLWRSQGVEPDLRMLHDRALTELGSGTSMVDVAQAISPSTRIADVLRSLTNDQPSVTWDWDELTWLTVEAVVFDEFEHLSRRKASARLTDVTGSECGDRVVWALSRWYGVELNTSAQKRQDMMRALLADGLQPAAVVESLKAAGFTVTVKSVESLRTRMRKSGDITLQSLAAV